MELNDVRGQRVSVETISDEHGRLRRDGTGVARGSHHKVGASKRRIKPKTGAVLSDEEEDAAKGEVTKSIPSRVRQGTAANSPRTEPKGRSARGTSKPEAMELKKEVARKTKPIASQYLRSPPINMPEASGTASVRRSARARPEPIKVDEEDYESEDNDDDEWEEKATPIAACHLRGPPIGPRPEQTPARPRYAVRWQDGWGGPTEPPAEPLSKAQRHAGFHRPPYRRGRDLAVEWEEPSPGPPTEEPSGVKVAMSPFWRDMFATCGVFTTLFLFLVCVEVLW